MICDDVEFVLGDCVKMFVMNGVLFLIVVVVDLGMLSKDLELKVRDGDVGVSVDDESARFGCEDVLGLDDFGLVVVDDDEEFVLMWLKLNEDVWWLSLLLRALDFSRRVGLIGALILFGIFFVFVVMLVYEEM